MSNVNPAGGAKPWYRSLTVQGAIVVAVAGAIQASGPAVLVACRVDPAVAAEVCKTLSQLLTDGGGAMALIGRLRLGDLS